MVIILAILIFYDAHCNLNLHLIDESGGWLSSSLDYSVVHGPQNHITKYPQGSTGKGKSNRRRQFKHKILNANDKILKKMMNGELPQHHVQIITNDEFKLTSDSSIVVSKPSIERFDWIVNNRQFFSEIVHVGSKVKIVNVKNKNENGVSYKILGGSHMRLLISVPI